MFPTELLKLHEVRSAELQQEAGHHRQIAPWRRKYKATRNARWLDRVAVVLAAVSQWSGSRSSALHHRAVSRRRATAHT